MRQFFSILCVAASAGAIALPGGLRPRLAARAEAAGRARARVSKRLPWRRKVETPDDCEVNCDDEKEFGSFAVTAEAPMPAPAAEEPLPKWRTDYLGSLDRLGKYSDDGFTLSTPLRYSSGDWWRHVLSMRRSLILKRVRGHVSFNILWSCAAAAPTRSTEGAPADETLDAYFRWLEAYPECLKQHLRGERDIAALTMLNNREREFLDATDNLPVGCTLAMSALLNRVKADSNEQSAKHLLWWQLEGELLHKLMGCVAARYDPPLYPGFTPREDFDPFKAAKEVQADPPLYPGFAPREGFGPFQGAEPAPEPDATSAPAAVDPVATSAPEAAAAPPKEGEHLNGKPSDKPTEDGGVDFSLPLFEELQEEDRPTWRRCSTSTLPIESLPADEREQVEGLRKMYEMQAWKKKADCTPSAPTWTASAPFA
ncbi:hypothetical protein JL720_13449 [Aureococcus anophagefferens]|nr:hypothetical protein JL720_13449 [Aureococcus anophagefferens]